MNENVTLIPARIRAGNRITRQENKPKLRVAAYCRVSTDSDEQAGSYEVQVQHYTEYIGRNREWELAGIYTDDGISGTNIKKREGFIEMIDDCMEGKVDMIITKSISRFARNTIDCLKYVRKLKEKNIAIIFEKENINTLEASGELLLTIMASLAQQESASLSQNIKLGLQFRYQEGKVQVNHEHFLGYTKDEDGKLIVDENEAKIVRRIFREYLEGASFRDIANGLEKDKIRTGGKRYKWHMSTVKGILSNEKYIGDALLQKTITTDFIEKTRIKNDGTVPQYYVKNSQEAIIARDIFTQVQEEMLRRANMKSGRDGQKRRIYSSKYALSSICICMKCGDIYRRIAWNNRGKKSTVWRCCTRVEHGPSACSASTIREEELQQAVIDAMNTVLEFSENTKNILKENIMEVIGQDNSDDITKLNNEIAEKQKELLELVHGKKDYSKCADEMEVLRDKKQLELVKHANTEGVKQRINELEEYINSQGSQISEYNDKLVRKYIDQIQVYDDKFVLCFKARMEIVVAR
ncbi:TPA: recombinase family protein [Streptococcus suis]